MSTLPNQPPIPGQQNQPTFNSNPTQPPTQPITQQSSATTPFEEKRPVNMKPIIFGVVFVIIIAAIVGGFIYLSGSKKDELKTEIDTQIKQFTSLKKNYSDILNIVQQSPQESVDETQLLGAFTSKVDPSIVEENPTLKLNEDAQTSTPEDVLGIEDDPSIVQMRRMGELYRTAKSEAVAIDGTNRSIQSTTANIINMFFLPKNDKLFDETDTFALDTINLLTYLSENNSIEIEGTTLGFEYGIVLAEAIIRGGDEKSVAKLDDILVRLEKLKEKTEEIDTTGLSGELQKQHQESIGRFDQDVKVLYDIVEDIRRKDAGSLEKNISSLFIDAGRQSEASLVSAVSFWQDNETLRGVDPLLTKWKGYKDSL